MNSLKLNITATCIIFSISLVNKRLDEWVGEDRMNFAKLELPRKEVKTPVKDGRAMNGSRPSSPERDMV